VLKPGQSATKQIQCIDLETNDVHGFGITDGIGGWIGFTTKPGKYKLCIRYQLPPPKPRTMLDDWSDKFSLKRSDFWQGWTVSNWIDIVIRDGK